MMHDSCHQGTMPCPICDLEVATSSRTLVPAACDACKKFFARNRNNLDLLKCSTGQGRCHIAADYIPGTKTRYPTCCRCRLIKCFLVGMNRRNSSKNRQSITDDAASTCNTSKAIIKKSRTFHLPSQQLNESGVVLELAVSASLKLAPLENIPLTKQQKHLTNDFEMWSATMASFDVAVKIGLTYVEHLSDIAAISTADKCQLLTGGAIPILMSHFAALPALNSAFFSMNPVAKASFLHNFPAFKHLDNDVNEAVCLFAAWKPSRPELALLQALCVFQIDLLQYVEKPGLVLEVNRQLSVALTSLAQQNSNPELRLYYHRCAFDLLRRIRGKHDEAIKQLGTFREDLMQMNRVYAEMFKVPANRRQLRVIALGLGLN